MGNPLLTKNYTAASQVGAYRIVKRTADHQVAHATAAGDAICGVTADLGAASGGRVDVHEMGIADVEFGGPVAVGDPVTAGASGKAVKATFTPGVVTRIVGYAVVAAVSGDIAQVMLAPGTIAQAAALADPLITVGEADSGEVSIQMRDANGDPLEAPTSVFAYLSANADGSSLAGSAPSGGVAIDTDGLAIPVVTGKAWHLVSEADGHIDLVITEASTATWYLVVVMPDGRLVVSPAISFTA